MFQFRLQRVLELREKSEQEAATQLAAARDEADAAREAESALERLRAETHQQLTYAQTGSSVGQLRNLSFVVEHLNRQIQEARSVSAAADENVRKLLGQFTAAFQERRVLDRLRERHLDAWRSSELHADRQAMDGIALSRFVRRASASGSAEG